jgi:16S rRNA (guanine527-N7)-methyltransferase
MTEKKQTRMTEEKLTRMMEQKHASMTEKKQTRISEKKGCMITDIEITYDLMNLTDNIYELIICLRNQGINTSWSPDEEFILSIEKYLSLLHKWNDTHDLVGPGKIQDFILPHIIDSLGSVLVLSSLMLVPNWEKSKDFSFSDIGSGAGLPGIPWHLWYQDKASSYLVEPRRKRCSFLKMVSNELGLKNLKVLEGRSKILKHEVDKIDVCLFRALKPDEEILGSLTVFNEAKLFWLSGPNVKVDKRWKEVASYYLLHNKTHERRIYQFI